jgi:hypothetical protein
MKLKLITILLVTLLISCKSEFDLFKDKVLEFANNDNQINQNEYKILIEHINQSEERYFQQFKNDNGEIDNTKVVSYLVKYFKAKNLNLTEDDIWQPITEKIKTTFNLNVYLENSASMDGYVKGVTEMDALVAYLQNLGLLLKEKR